MEIKEIEKLDSCTLEHCNSVASLCYDFGVALDLGEEQIKKLELIGHLHDIGKLDVPLHILNKPTRLTEDEWKEIQQHPVNGYKRASLLGLNLDVCEAILYHHVRPDGNGYPVSFSAEEISFYAKVITIVDAYDAMISDRPYREGMSKEEAIGELKENVGIQFEDCLVEIFINKVLND